MLYSGAQVIVLFIYFSNSWNKIRDTSPGKNSIPISLFLKE